jgi:hypothetical protein
MKRGLMEPDPHARALTLVETLWVVAAVMGLIVVLLSYAD